MGNEVAKNNKGNGNQAAQGTPEHPKKIRLSVGIDFGTTNSAMAYSYAENKDNIHVFDDYGDGVPTRGKIPTAVLFNEEKEFVDFGNRAILRYKDYVRKEQHKDVYLFRNFKMSLYKNDDNIKQDMLIYDITGKTMKALDVFKTSIKFFQTTILTYLKLRKEIMDIKEDDCKWVITVPAIWSERSKQFMRTAAEEAGCFWHSIVIALEPETAAISCRNEPELIERYFNVIQKNSNTKYLVVDIGGGTLDIAAHQLNNDQSISEIYRASGNNTAGNLVDEAFVELLKTLFSNENVEEIRAEYPEEFMKIMEEFKQAKQRLIFNNIAEFPIELSHYCPWNIQHFQNLSPEIKRNIHFSSRCNTFSFPREEIIGLIKQVSQNIQQFIASLLTENVDLKDLKYILMVGGFSNSPIIVHNIKDITKVPVIVPERAELCVVKGAVMFGWAEDIVRSRKSRKTYGFGIRTAFIEGKHDEKRALVDLNGKRWCNKCFEKLVTINQDVPYNHKVVHVTKHGYYKGTTSYVKLYATDNPNPMYTDEKGMSLIGEIKIPSPNDACGKDITKEVYFGHTEIKVIIKDEHSGKIFEGTFSMMANNTLKIKMNK